MIKRSKLQEVLSSEPRGLESYPDSPGQTPEQLDEWGEYPIIRWDKKTGEFFLPTDKQNLGLSVPVQALDVRIKALRAMRSVCHFFLDPEQQGFRYCYSVANHKQMVDGFEFCVWGFELLLYNIDIGKFRLYLNSPSMHDEYFRLAESDLDFGTLTTEKRENRLYEYLIPVVKT